MSAFDGVSSLDSVTYLYYMKRQGGSNSCPNQDLTTGAFVENVTGTGFVHIAPGHGLEDYNLGMAHGLPIYSPVDDDGRFTHTSDLPVEPS